MRTKRGFTDHEQLDEVEIIHMNGRIYDPRLGRFLNADPIVQAPFYSQSYNRYAYTFNSPLSFVDPSGFGAIENLRNLPSSVERWADSGWQMLTDWMHENTPAEREFGGDPSGANTPVPTPQGNLVFAPDGATWVTADRYNEYLSERSRLTERLEIWRADPEMDAVLRRQIAALHHDLYCDLDYCSVEPTLGPVELVVGLPIRGAFAAGGAVKILEREGNVIIASFRGAAGEARVITEMVREGETLILRGTHIEGSATLKEALNVASQFGREQGVKRVIIEGGRRTTGANPGHIPRSITVETGL